MDTCSLRGLQVGDYGLGYCANSLELGCDCLGTIKYFDADMIDSKGELPPDAGRNIPG